MGGLEVLGSRPLTYTHTHRATSDGFGTMDLCFECYNIISKTLFIETI